MLMETHRLTAPLPLDISIFSVVPINDKILALAGTKEMKETEAKTVMEQFEEWRKSHVVRMAAGGLGWALGTIALILF